MLDFLFNLCYNSITMREGIENKERQMTRKQAQIARIKRMQALLKKDKTDYTAEDQGLVRQIIEKHIADDEIE